MRGRDAQLELDASHPFERALADDAVRGDGIGEDTQGEDLHRGHPQDPTQDDGLEVPGAVAVHEPVVQEGAPRDQGAHGQQACDHREHPQRLVARVDAEDRDDVAPDVRRHRLEQPRLARLVVGPDRDVVDGHEALAGLDQRLERVGELGDDGEPERGVAVVGAETRCGIGDRRVGRLADDPATDALEPPFRHREVLDGHDVAVADHHVGLAGHDGRHEGGDVRRRVLVVRVGVDHDVGAEFQRGVEPGLERRGEALVVGEPDDVVDAVPACHLDRGVGRAVVDDQPLHLVEPGDLARQVAERGGKLCLFVEAGDLDDEFHDVRWVDDPARPGMRVQAYAP